MTPFIVFQNTRGATFTTLGNGLTQAPISDPNSPPPMPVDIAPNVPLVQQSLSALNATYATTFDTFSPLRLFVPELPRHLQRSVRFGQPVHSD